MITLWGTVLTFMTFPWGRFSTFCFFALGTVLTFTTSLGTVLNFETSRTFPYSDAKPKNRSLNICSRHEKRPPQKYALNVRSVPIKICSKREKRPHRKSGARFRAPLWESLSKNQPITASTLWTLPSPNIGSTLPLHSFPSTVSFLIPLLT